MFKDRSWYIVDDKKKWSLETGGHSKEVQFAWNLMVDKNFNKFEIGLSRQCGLFRRVHSRQVLLYQVKSLFQLPLHGIQLTAPTVVISYFCITVFTSLGLGIKMENIKETASCEVEFLIFLKQKIPGHAVASYLHD